jgi:hypothetical protein
MEGVALPLSSNATHTELDESSQIMTHLHTNLLQASAYKLTTGISPAPSPLLMGAAGGGLCLLLLGAFVVRQKLKGSKTRGGDAAGRLPLLPCCYRVVTVLLPCCYRVVTVFVSKVR